MSRIQTRGLMLTFGLLAAGAWLAPPVARAQAPRRSPKPWLDQVVTTGGHNTCQEMSWNARRDEQGHIRGVIWYTGGAGVSNAIGQAEPDGHFTIKVTSIYGSGPVGTVTGVRNADGSIDAEFVGTSCRTGALHIVPGQTSTHS